jgi:hypothetical protein
MIELLLVLFLIAIVVSLLLPTFASTRFVTRDLLCKNNMREIGRGFTDFAASNRQRLPGNSDQINPRVDPAGASWLYYSKDFNTGANLSPKYRTAPESGTLFEFVRHKKLYRCPSLPAAPIGSGGGSNGMFDYGMLNALYGARLDRLPVNAHFPYTVPNNSTTMAKYDTRMMPILVEEHPMWSVNTCCIEADFSNVDVMANTHRLTGINLPGAAANYIASDCSVQGFRRDDGYQVAKYIWALNTQFGTANFLGWVGPTPVGQWDNGLYARNKPASAGGIAHGTRVPKAMLPIGYKDLSID